MNTVPLSFSQARTPELVMLRRELHQAPEVSGEEALTAARIMEFVERLNPDRLVSGLGGHGVAAVFDSGQPGPSVLFRCELDGLPIKEISAVDWRSRTDGKGHLCGHDGHMAIVCGLGMALAARRPARGRVIVLFQPAEETGAGAAAVIADPDFSSLRPDFAFALHNLPGLPLGTEPRQRPVRACFRFAGIAGPNESCFRQGSGDVGACAFGRGRIWHRAGAGGSLGDIAQRR